MPAPRLPIAELPRRAVMGVVNVTPDSFSDGGNFFEASAAIAHGRDLVAAGAAILDVGGESTRPGAEPVRATDEMARVLPVIRALVADGGAPVSIDTTKAEVAAAALEAGAAMVNDVSGGNADPEMFATVARANAAYVVMHMRGTPQTMRAEAHYDDVVTEVASELRARVDAAIAAGIDPAAMLADPGIGFAKTGAHNIELLRDLSGVAARVGLPLLIGVSRKSFLGEMLGGAGPGERDDATLAATVWSFVQGAAVVRVHDVAASVRAAELFDVMERAA